MPLLAQKIDEAIRQKASGADVPESLFDEYYDLALHFDYRSDDAADALIYGMFDYLSVARRAEILGEALMTGEAVAEHPVLSRFAEDPEVLKQLVESSGNIEAFLEWHKNANVSRDGQMKLGLE